VKLTKKTLKQIIKEELNKVLKEEDDGPTPGNIVDKIVFDIERATQQFGTDEDSLGEIANILQGLNAAQIAKIKAKYDSTASEALLNVLEDEGGQEAQQVRQLVIQAWASSLGRLSPGKARQEINRHLKSGQINKDMWRKLRRKHHRRRKKKRVPRTVAGQAAALKKTPIERDEKGELTDKGKTAVAMRHIGKMHSGGKRYPDTPAGRLAMWQNTPERFRTPAMKKRLGIK
tara:strand:- start:6826 stop:7518 length:693 start_codon:yes stop_codon:yes gene_type:complete